MVLAARIEDLMQTLIAFISASCLPEVVFSDCLDNPDNPSVRSGDKHAPEPKPRKPDGRSSSNSSSPQTSILQQNGNTKTRIYIVIETKGFRRRFVCSGPFYRSLGGNLGQQSNVSGDIILEGDTMEPDQREQEIV